MKQLVTRIAKLLFVPFLWITYWFMLQPFKDIPYERIYPPIVLWPNPSWYITRGLALVGGAVLIWFSLYYSFRQFET